MEQIRLAKALAKAGVASRRAAEEMVFQGDVKVDGKIVLVPQTPVSFGKNRIEVRGKVVKDVEKKYYFILHKPKGFICSSSDPYSKKLVIDLFAQVPARLFTVGRLDRDSVGLLIVTNDGAFSNKIIHPSSNVLKEYLVTVKEYVTPEQVTDMTKGCFVEGKFVRPVLVKKIRTNQLKVVVREGKKREVRCFVQKADLTILELKRTAIGGLKLGRLPHGHFRDMSKREMELIFER